MISRYTSMRSLRLAFTLGAFFMAFVLKAQHDHSSEETPNVTLHVNPKLGMCDFDIASNLSQSEWSRATREIGNILYLDPLSAPVLLRPKKFSIQLESSSAHVDQESGAWNNTFHHPDSTHYLTGPNGRISVPGLRFRMGIAPRMDAGIYYTSAKPFGANYGFMGADFRYAFLQDTTKHWFAAVRGSFITDANIKDFNITSTGIDITASKTFFGMLMPYAGAAMNWNHGHIVSNEVNLSNENSFGARGLAGVELRWRFLHAAYEVQFGDGMANSGFKIGASF